MNSPAFQRWRARLADHRLHELLWYCVPGVVVALLVRGWLTASMPYGQFHFDTPDFLQTPYDLLHDHRLTLHNKKTFLTPLLYTLPFLLRVPALIVIPIGQHLLGTALVLAVGALARLWFVYWRWFIVPLTVLTAAHPAFLWFEHTLLAESQYIFCVVALALAGTMFVRWPNWETFGFLLAALFFTAGARPEGRLFLAFGVLVTLLVYRGQLRREMAKFVTLFVFCGLALIVTRTAQAGILLYTSILHLAPDQSKVAPDLMPCLRPMRDKLRRSRALKISNDVVHIEKRLTAQIMECYAPKHPELQLGVPKSYNAKKVNALCLKLAIETARAHPFQLPGIVLVRFLARIDDDSGGQFLNHDVQTRQYRALVRGERRNGVLGAGLAGVPLDTDNAISGFIYQHYDERRVAWYNRWETFWMDAISALRLPDIRYSAEYQLPGLPLFYVVALLGAVVMALAGQSTRTFHRAFLPVLGGVWFTVTLTGAIMPRYRFVLEPFWLLYFFACADGIARLSTRRLPNMRLPDAGPAAMLSPAP